MCTYTIYGYIYLYYTIIRRLTCIVFYRRRSLNTRLLSKLYFRTPRACFVNIILTLWRVSRTYVIKVRARPRHYNLIIYYHHAALIIELVKISTIIISYGGAIRVSLYVCNFQWVFIRAACAPQRAMLTHRVVAVALLTYQIIRVQTCGRVLSTAARRTEY